jgi:FkbM family methyltransferase
MKLVWYLLLSAPIYQLIAKIELSDLPWVNGFHAQNIYYAARFLPNDPVILEAGTYDGTDTKKFKELWGNATIYGFEPNRISYNKTCENIKGMKNVHIFPVALSNYVGWSIFYVSQANDGASSLYRDNFKEAVKSIPHIFYGIQEDHYKDYPIEVPVTTIDTWGKENQVSHIDYMWLDAEGAELNILKGAGEYLKNVRVISIEVNFKEFRVHMAQFEDVYDFLIEQGFELKYIWGSTDVQSDAIFINKGFQSEELNTSIPYAIPQAIKR